MLSTNSLKRLVALVGLVVFLFSFAAAHAEDDYIPGTWLRRNMKDSFGDPTDDKYILCVMEGTFERLAKSGSNSLIVTLQVGEDGGGLYFLIKLFQYGRSEYQVTNSDPSQITKYTIHVKDDNGTVYEFPAHMYKHDDCIVFENEKDKLDFVNMMKNNEVLKVYITDEPIYKNGILYDYYTYNFKIQYPDNFSEAFDWLGIETK